MSGLDRSFAAVEEKPPATTNPRAFALPPPIACDDCYVRLNADSLHDLMSPVNQIGTLVALLLNRNGGALD